jgi:signal transduction histidine kinase
VQLPVPYNPPLTRRGQLWRILLATLIGGLIWLTVAPAQLRESPTLFWLDLALGVLATGLVLFRRRWPLAIAVILACFGAVSALASGAGLLSGVSLATRRVYWQIALVGVVSVGAGQLFPLIQPSTPEDPWWVTLAFGIAFTIAALAWGMYLGSRRELLWTLREQVRRTAAEQELRVAQGRSTERARIAREMHDVLAHRISLITLHAGALAYREDLSSAQIRETAELIQTKSHEALHDLRHVLGVLRSDNPDALDQPQPTMQDLGSLVLEAEQSGMSVVFQDDVHDADAMPEQIGRTAYRIVQEGLTNAHKHAPGTTVLVSLTGSPEVGLDIRIRNPARSATPSSTPGAGLGLREAGCTPTAVAARSS